MEILGFQLGQSSALGFLVCELGPQARVLALDTDQVEVVMKDAGAAIGKARGRDLEWCQPFHHQATRLGDALVRPHSTP